MKNRAYLPDPAKKIYNGLWCFVSCEGKDSDLNQFCKLFQDLNCCFEKPCSPPKKAIGSDRDRCDVTCEYRSSSQLCPTFQRLNC